MIFGLVFLPYQYSAHPRCYRDPFQTTDWLPLTVPVLIVLDDGKDAADGGAATVDGVTGGRAALRRWRVLMGNLVLHIAKGKSALAAPHIVRRHVGVSLSRRRTKYASSYGGLPPSILERLPCF